MIGLDHGTEFKKYKTNQRWCTNCQIHFFTCNLWKLWHIFLIAIKGTHKGNGRPWNYTKQARDNFGRPWNICKFVKVGGGVRLLFYLLDAWIGSHSMLVASWATSQQFSLQKFAAAEVSHVYQ